MGKKMKDIDYLVVSARIRAKENSLLTQERMEQVLAARSDEEAAKLLREYGYPALNAGDRRRWTRRSPECGRRRWQIWRTVRRTPGILSCSS